MDPTSFDWTPLWGIVLDYLEPSDFLVYTGESISWDDGNNLPIYPVVREQKTPMPNIHPMLTILPLFEGAIMQRYKRDSKLLISVLGHRWFNVNTFEVLPSKADSVIFNDRVVSKDKFTEKKRCKPIDDSIAATLLSLSYQVRRAHNRLNYHPLWNLELSPQSLDIECTEPVNEIYPLIVPLLVEGSCANIFSHYTLFRTGYKLLSLKLNVDGGDRSVVWIIHNDWAALVGQTDEGTLHYSTSKAFNEPCKIIYHNLNAED